MNVWLALQHILVVSILALVLWVLVLGGLDLYHDWQADREWDAHLPQWKDEVCVCSHNKSSHRLRCWEDSDPAAPWKFNTCSCEAYREYRP